ncbi:MAG: nucleotidyltransferase [Lysobacterales bacterium]
MAGPAKIPQDWSELLTLLQESGAEFLVVGAYALAAHGHERYTKDLDLWLAPKPESAMVVARLLEEFGFPDLAPDVGEWVEGKVVVQLGREPYRIDLLNFATGLVFEEAYANRVTGILGGVPVACLDKDALVANKLATGRTQDFADAEAIAPERLDEIRVAMKKKLLELD